MKAYAWHLTHGPGSHGGGVRRGRENSRQVRTDGRGFGRDFGSEPRPISGRYPLLSAVFALWRLCSQMTTGDAMKIEE